MIATLITRTDLARRWGKCSRTIIRLELNPPPGFPTPLRINRFCHYRIADVEAFERSLAGRREAA